MRKGRLVVYLVLIIVSFVLLYERFRLGLARFLDLDEYAHLHWSFNAWSGLVPYKDFFYIFTPFYLYLVSLLLNFTPLTFDYVLKARALSFFIYLVGVVALFFIAKKRGALFGLVTTFVFIYLPLPSDKWLEVRPDGLGIVLTLVGVAFFSYKKYLAAGLFLSLGTVVNPKAIFYLLSVLLAWMVERESIRKLPFFIVGLSLPLLVLLFYFIWTTTPNRAFYSVFRLHQTAGELMGRRFPMAANLFFYPNDIYYGEGGFNFNYLNNLAIYVIAVVTAVISLVSLSNVLPAMLLLTNLIAYIKIFPLKHTQYLLGVSPWIAYFFVVFIFKMPKKIFFVTLAIYLLLIAYQGHLMNKSKMRFGNYESQYFLEEAGKRFSDKDYVWDLTGAAIFHKDPYYICCLPYGEYERMIEFPLPDLKESLKAKNVKYIFIQEPRFLNLIPEYHRDIVEKYYTPIPDVNFILIRK